MELFFRICCWVSVGTLAGFLIGSIRARFRRSRSEEQLKGYRAFYRLLGRAFQYLTFLLLILGFVWCVFFLVLGAVQPGQAEYATNMSQLIVSVLTILSIAFAFYEFLRRK